MNSLREQIADELSGWPLGSGYYQTTVPPEEAFGMADAVIHALGLREERRLGIRNKDGGVRLTELNERPHTWVAPPPDDTPTMLRYVTDWEETE